MAFSFCLLSCQSCLHHLCRCPFSFPSRCRLICLVEPLILPPSRETLGVYFFILCSSCLWCSLTETTLRVVDPKCPYQSVPGCQLSLQRHWSSPVSIQPFLTVTGFPEEMIITYRWWYLAFLLSFTLDCSSSFIYETLSLSVGALMSSDGSNLYQMFRPCTI